MSNSIEIDFPGKCLKRVYQCRRNIFVIIEHLGLKACHLLVFDLEQHLSTRKIEDEPFLFEIIQEIGD